MNMMNQNRFSQPNNFNDQLDLQSLLGGLANQSNAGGHQMGSTHNFMGYQNDGQHSVSEYPAFNDGYSQTQYSKYGNPYGKQNSIGGSSYQKYADYKNNPPFHSNYDNGSNFGGRDYGGISDIDKNDKSYPRNFRDSNTLNMSMVSFSDFQNDRSDINS